MTVHVSVPLADSAYERAKRLARSRQQEIVNLLAEFLDDVLLRAEEAEEFIDWSEPDAAVEQEQAAYRVLHKVLWEKYPHQHVAIHGGKLIDHDVDGAALSERIEQRYPNEFVLIKQVEAEPERILYVRSPRLVQVN